MLSLEPEKIISSTFAIEQDLESLKSIREIIKQAQERQSEIEARIKEFMKDASLLQSFDGTICATWKDCRPATRFDISSFKASQPSMYNQFLKAGEATRRFLVK